MINEDKKKLYDEDIERFMPMLGTVSDKYLQKLQKINEKNPNFIMHLVAMLIGNENLHEWTTTDLLSKSKRLVGEFKRSGYFKAADRELKKFINDDFTKSINYIKIIAIDLERLGFKEFWLKEKLPVLKERISEYQVQLDHFDIVAHVNQWVVTKKKFKCEQWYVLSFSGNHFEFQLGYFGVISPITSARNLFEKVVSYVLKIQDYTGLMRKFKPDPVLKAEFKGHEKREVYRKLTMYVEACLKMSIKVYLMETLPEVMRISLPEGYPFATNMLSYLRENEKRTSVMVSGYLIDMLRHFSK